MGKRGIPMSPEDRLEIIELYDEGEGLSLREIMEKKGYSNTVIKQTIEDYLNGRIDAEGNKKDISIGESDGEFKKTINPIEFVWKK